MLFKKKAKEVTYVDIGNEHWVTVPIEVGKYIDSLKLEYKALEREYKALEREYKAIEFKTKCLEEELKVIKPMVAEATFKQAMTADCINCKYVAISSWDEKILCCIKNNVCEDFVSGKGENHD